MEDDGTREFRSDVGQGSGESLFVGRWGPRGFALFAAAVMVLVVFSQNVGIGEGAAGDGPDFEEESRRLTVAGGVSRAPQLSVDASGALHVAWADARAGSFGPYVKSSRGGGLTFSGDRALGRGFQSISTVGIAADPSSRTVAVAWGGAVGTDPPRVFVRASPDSGRTWATPGVVGPGSSASVAVASGEVLLAYVHGNGTPPSQVRLVALSLGDAGGIRTGRGLFAFNASASDVALSVSNGTAHVAWAEEISGVVVLAHVSVNLATGSASPAHVVATARARLGGEISLAGQGARLALVWSDDSAGTYDVKGRMSLDGGSAWPVSLDVASGAGNAVEPGASLGGGGRIAVAWQDDATGRDQVHARLFGPDGNPLTPSFRVSASPVAARDRAVVFGAGRDLVAAWSDGRHDNSEVYGDLDVLLDRPRASTLRAYARRLPDFAYAPPPAESRATLVGLIEDAREIALRVILKMTESFGFGWVVGLVIGAIVGVFVGIKIADIVYGNRVQEVIPAGFDDWVDWAFAVTEFILALGVLLAAWVRGWKTLGKAAVGLWATVISFLIVGISANVSARGDRLGLELAVFLDIVAVLFAVAGLGYPYDILYDYSLLNPVASALGYAALVTSLASLAADVVSFTRLSSP